jgi:hypothetical protein
MTSPGSGQISKRWEGERADPPGIQARNGQWRKQVDKTLAICYALQTVKKLR